MRQKRRSKVTGLSDQMTLFFDLGCLYCKQTQRAFNVFPNTLNWLKIDSVDQKFNWLECGNFSQDAGTPSTERVIAFSQLAVKWLKRKCAFYHFYFFYKIFNFLQQVSLHFIYILCDQWSWRRSWTCSYTGAGFLVAFITAAGHWRCAFETGAGHYRERHYRE
jgi:hypothetical protein